MDKEKVRFGLSGCAIAFFDSESTAVTPTWQAPEKTPGAVSLTMDPQNKEVVFHADNIAFYTVTSTTGAKGELDISLLADETMIKMFGWEKDENGALVEIANSKSKNFALLFQIETDISGRRNVYFNCSAGQPKTEHSTNNEGIDIKTTKIPIIATPILINDRLCIKASLMQNKNPQAYDKWYDAVYLPTFVAAETTPTAPVEDDE